MSFETDLRSKLTADAGISAIVGTRIYWETRPQNSALPAIVLTEVFGSHDQSHDGPIDTQGNRIQFDCMAKTKEEAVDLRALVIAEIETPGTSGSTEFQGGFVRLTRATATDTASGIVRTAMIDASIWFNELVS